MHAYFIQMGGIVFKEEGKKGKYKDFKTWTNGDIRSFFALKLTEEKLKDWSKADGLAKAFVIVQCLWFVVQCIGRAVFRLPLIELEVTCFAFIACNVGMHAFWWNKPLNVNCPEVIVIQPSGTPNDERESTTGVSQVRSDSESPRSAKSSTFLGWPKTLIEVLATGDIGKC